MRAASNPQSRFGLTFKPWQTRRGAFRAGRKPKSKKILGEIFHTGATLALRTRKIFELRNYGCPLLKVAPQFVFQRPRSGVKIGIQVAQPSNLVQPILSLLRMSLHIIPQKLLSSVQAHGVHRACESE